MSVNDPIGDMLTRIRNACMARHTTVTMPASKMKIAIADILKREGFIRDYTVIDDGKPYKTISITLKYMSDRRP
ncbi:30S ribosomal protein S8, partial [uncultured Chloroflexus sp.]